MSNKIKLPGADISHIGLSFFELFCRAKVTKNKTIEFGVNKNILGLNISMTNTEIVNISKGSKHLIGINFAQHIWELIFDLVIITQDLVKSVWNIIHNQVQVNIIFLLFSLGEKVLINLINLP